MKINCKAAFIILITAVFFISCRVEKRHYSRGYYVSWLKKKPDSRSEIAHRAAESKNEKQKCDVVSANAISKSVAAETRVVTACAENITKKSTGAHSHSAVLLFQKPFSGSKRAATEKKLFKPEEPKLDEEDAWLALGLSVGGFIFLGPVGSVLGLIWANKALKQIKEHPDKYGGKEKAELAKLLAIIGIILFIVVLAFILTIWLVILATW